LVHVEKNEKRSSRRGPAHVKPVEILLSGIDFVARCATRLWNKKSGI
jgi:hypothetical protein